MTNSRDRGPSGPRAPDGLDRAYRAIARTYPPEFLSRFGAEMLELFRARRADARARGGLSPLFFLIATFRDLAASIWRERRRARGLARERAHTLVAGPGAPRTPRGRSLGDDVRTAMRRLRRSPALTLTVVALMALTIGSATVVFSVVNAVLLRPLPYGAPDRIALLWETRVNARQNVIAGHELPAWAERNRTFADVAAMIYDEGLHLTGAGDPKAMWGVRVSASFFRVMGVEPALGRAFLADEDTPGHGQVVILSDRLWRERFNADRAVLGREIHLNDRAFQVIGVMPASFGFPPVSAGVTPDVWMPIADRVERYVGRHYLYAVGRLKPGVTFAQAREDLAAVAASVEKDFPGPSHGHGATASPLQEDLVREVRPSLMLLLGAVASLVLIGCSNVASLLLARGLVRRREVALELALGATPARAIQQLLIESVAMAAAGGLVGLGIAAALVRVVPALVPPGSLTVDAIAIDRWVLVFAFAISTATGVIFGMAPALQLRHADPGDALRQGGRSLIGGTHARMRRLLVTAQVGLAVLFLLGASLMTRGLVALHRVDPGFVTGNTLVVDLSLRGERYAGPAEQREFFESAESAVAGIPGVVSVGAADSVPLSGHLSGISVQIEGRAERPSEEAGARYHVVSPGYFQTLRVPFLAGRDFAAADARVALPLIRWFPQQPLPPGFEAPQAAPVAIVNESMAQRYWPDGALARRFKVIDSPWVTVVGIVRDMHTVSLQAETGPEFYLTNLQEPQAGMQLIARTATPPLDLAPSVRSAIANLDRNLPIASITTMEDVRGDGYGRSKFTASLLATFALIALVLMTAGVYGLLAFTTSQRLPEMGIRVALGAARGQIYGQILREGLAMAVAGIVVGLAAAVALGRYVADQLFGVTPTDLPTFAGVTLLVLVVVMLACWRPARRAARVDPISVLRQD